MMIFNSENASRLTITVDGDEVFNSSTYTNDVLVIPMYFKKGSVLTFTRNPLQVFPLIGG